MKNDKNQNIIVINDDKIGANSQAIGLAIWLKKICNYNYQIINLEYNNFSFLPNFLLKNKIFYLTENSKKKLSSIDKNFTIVISAGRMAAVVSSYIKNNINNQIKTIQIMNPCLDFKKFDFVILPKHDKKNNQTNVVRSIGALSKIDLDEIENSKNNFLEFSQTTKKKIVVLFGGSSKKTNFEIESAKKFIQQINNIASNMNACLFILNSRRTSKEINLLISKNIKSDHYFFDWCNFQNNNPYLSSIANADFFIVTGDSVSMISECCIAGKPVYIFDDKNLSSKKHRLFHQYLFSNNHAKKLLENDLYLDDFKPNILNEAKRIAAYISDKI